MKNHFHILLLLIIALTTSCSQKQQKSIAINVLLTVPEDVYDQAIQLNRSLLENHPDNITLDANHIPHITVLQCYVLEINLPKIEHLLHGLYKNIENDTLSVDELQYVKDKTESFASLGIEKSIPLMALHKKTIELLKPFFIINGSQESYVQNTDGTPIDKFTIAYVPKFVSHHSYENYNPHLSLGVAETLVLDSLEKHSFRVMKFKATSISVYQLGAFGTAQKLIWISE